MNRFLLRRTQGFTLTELAVVLVIIALLIGGMLMPLGAQNDLRRVAETRKTLDEIREALLGFAATNGRLPCPDTNLDGIEDCIPSTADPREGWLPFATMGTSRTDAWNNRFRYSVSAAFATSSPSFLLTTPGTIQIETRGDIPATQAVETKAVLHLASNIPAVVISLGKNGSGAVTGDGLVLPILASSGADETANASDGSTKWSRVPANQSAGCSDTAEGSPFCDFDDIVIWLSPNILYSKMIAAGRLP